MGDVRYGHSLRRLLEQPGEAMPNMGDEELIGALAACSDDSTTTEPYLVNVIATELMNRVRRRATIIDESGEGMAVLDEEGRLVFVNSAAETILGRRQGELTGMSIHDAVHGRAASGCSVAESCPLSAVASGGTRLNLDNAEFTRGDGASLPISGVVAPVFRDAVPSGAVLVFRDASDVRLRQRRRAARTEVDEVLARAEVRSADVASSILSAIGRGYDWDIGTFWRIDETTARLRCLAVWHRDGLECRGFEHLSMTTTFERGAGIPGMTWETRNPAMIEDFRQLRSEKFPRVVEAKRIGLRGAFAFPCFSAAGEAVAVIDFFSRSLRVPDEEFLDAVSALGSRIGAFLDREGVADRLRASEARVRGMLDAALDAIITIDRDSRILEFNRAAESMFGWTRDDVLGRPLTDFIIPPRFREAHNNGMTRFLATGEGPVLGHRIEMPALRKDGTEIPVELTITAIESMREPTFTAHLRDLTRPGAQPADGDAKPR